MDVTLKHLCYAVYMPLLKHLWYKVCMMPLIKHLWLYEAIAEASMVHSVYTTAKTSMVHIVYHATVKAFMVHSVYATAKISMVHHC